MVVALLALSSPLLNGVSEIGAPGIPGPLVVHGDQAQVVVSAKQGRFDEPVIAKAIHGGRIVAFGHGGYFGEGVFGQGQTRLLLANAIEWAMPKGGVAGIHRATGLESILHSKGIQTRRLSEMDLANLDGLALLVIDPNGESPKHADVIRKHVDGGGGLLIAGLGWGWLQLNPGKRISEHPCNLIAGPMGISWGDGYMERNTAVGFAANPGPKETHAGNAFAALRAGSSTGTVGQVLTRAVETLPLDHRIITGVDLLASTAGDLPSEQRPIKPDNALFRLKLALDLRRIREASPADQKPHPAANTFPGAPLAGASSVAKTFEIDLSRPRWQGTGLYAPPGKVIKATTTASGLRIRIGAHSDRLWHLDDWKRAPEVDLSLPLAPGGMEVASAFGGAVYIEVPARREGKASITIEGAIEAPRYVHGKTSLVDWRLSRHAPAPWAEIESSKIAITVPSEHIRSLDNPIRLMEFWDRVADACADLATIPRERASPERYVADVQISAGYMHAGYPIMTHLDAAPRMVDLAFLSDPVKGGDWGMFHEIGHNHQHPDWTFDGTGEVTVNLFTLYIIETVVGRVPGYHVRWTDAELQETFRKHRASGAPFDKWKSDPFLALVMYVQLQKAFGWDAYKKVFAEYRALPQSERPKNDAEKRDQWMVRFSRAVNRDLGPFFQAWGVPVSLSARQSIKDLPVWNFTAEQR